jgi:hypothetical protein
MSADKDRAIRRQKQKRAKDNKKRGPQTAPARPQPDSTKNAPPQKSE